MMLSDLFFLRKHLRWHALIWVALGLFVVIAVGNVPAIIVFIAFIETLMTANTLIRSDKNSGWNRGRIALPLSRTDIVVGRFLSLGSIALGSVALGTALFLCFGSIVAALPALSEFARYLPSFDAPTLALCIAGALASSLAAVGILLSLAARSDSADASGYAACGIALVLFGAFQALSPSGMGVFERGMIVLAAGTTQTLILAVGIAALGIAALGIAFYAASGALAVWLYSKREF